MDYFETGFFGGNQKAWHGLGTVIPEDVVAAAEAITLAGLDWEVQQVPVFAQYGSTKLDLEDFRANVRSTDQRVLGVVGKGYQPVQNSEAFNFMDILVGSEDAKYHTAGSLRDGKKVWMLARLNRDILIGGEESERIAPFILLSNGHDGYMGLTVAVTPIRVVCWNTLSAALAGAKRTWSTRHTSGILDRIALAQDASETLELSFKFFDKLEEVGGVLIGEKFSKRSMENLVKNLIPIKDEDTEGFTLDGGGRSAKNRQEAREAILAIFANEENLDNVRGTKWAAYQAVAQYEDHEARLTRSKDEEKRLERQFQRSVLWPKLKSGALAQLAPQFAAKATSGKRGDLAAV